MRAVGPERRSIERAFGLGPALLERAATERRPWIAGSVIEGPAVALGALQRAGRVVDLDAARAAGVRVLRRTTSGTAVYIGRVAILWTLALPHVAALVPDASPSTLLNRNVRGFLQGLSRQGAIANYFGREWIAVKHRPAALLGFEATPEGAVLIEVIAGIDAPIALPAAFATETERAVDRWLGKDPASLEEVMVGAIAPEALAGAVIEAVAARALLKLAAMAVPEGAGEALEVTGPEDPLPPGFQVGPMVRVPIGWLETAIEPGSGRVWLGGDVLAPGFAAQAIAGAAGHEEAPAVVAPTFGATMGDLVAAVRAADSARRQAPA